MTAPRLGVFLCLLLALQLVWSVGQLLERVALHSAWHEALVTADSLRKLIATGQCAWFAPSDATGLQRRDTIPPLRGRPRRPP